MKKIVLKILVILLKILYLPMRLLKVQNKITYMSRQSNNESIDFKRIREQMENSYPEYKNIVLTKKIENDIISKMAYCIEVFRQMYHLATSKIIILDTYCITACVLPHKRATKIIQIWHALGAIKKFGYQTLDTKWGTKKEIAETMCMHKNYTYVFAPSKVTAKLYMKAFNIEKEKIKYFGMPRIDYILEKNETKTNKIYSKYPILKNKINILYLPTFRKGEKVELDELVKGIDTTKYNMIVKLHPLDLKKYEYIKREGIIYDSQTNTYDLLKISNKVITDYSSLSIEASLLNVPVYFYTYDIERYNEETGINFDFEKEALGKYKTSSAKELLSIMEKPYDYTALQSFKDKFISIDTNNCTKQIVEFIARLIRNEEVKNMGNEPIKEKQNI